MPSFGSWTSSNVKRLAIKKFVVNLIIQKALKLKDFFEQ